MLPQLDTVQTSIPDKFPDLFTGIGTMKEMYTIKMEPNAKPHALYTPKNVPLPLRAKVQAELMRMERMGAIFKVEVSTPWCAGMVVVPRLSVKVRIYIILVRKVKGYLLLQSKRQIKKLMPDKAPVENAMDNT